MINGQRFPFIERTDALGYSNMMPYLPLILNHNDNSMEVIALLDTGSAVNVIPYNIGINLGVVWEEQNLSISLSGNLAKHEAKGILLLGTVGNFSPIWLVFAWSQSNDIPIILGHLNFFDKFNVCFYRHESIFEVSPHDKGL